MHIVPRLLTCLALAAAVAWPAAAPAGTITAYTALEEDDVKVYLDAFAREVPDVRVNVLRLSTGDLIARILAEKANPRHDVIWGVAVTQVVDPRILEMAEPYKPKGIDEVKTIFKDPEHRWFGTFRSPLGILFNNRKYKKEDVPQTWDDLLKPEWKGKITFRKPLASGTMRTFIGAMVLRARSEDVAPLVEHFIERFSAQYGVATKRVAADVLERLRAHPWPGNVRELQNVIERAFALSSADTITLAELPPPLRDAVSRDPVEPEREEPPTLEEAERRVIAAALRRSGGNKNEAARILRIDRQRLYRKIEKYGLG